MPIRLSRIGLEDFLSLNRIGTKNGVIHPSPTQNTPTANLGVFKMTSLKEVKLRYWRKPGGGNRHYVQNLPELIGLELTYYKTGNISSARLNREHCSNNRAYREIGECGRVWLDDNEELSYADLELEGKEPPR